MNQVSNSFVPQWQQFTALQQPGWENDPRLADVKNKLTNLPPLVFAGEIENLKQMFSQASEGKAFLLQGGDCSESFDECNPVTIRETLKVLLQMAIVLTYTGKNPVIKVGRIAGQYAKPRSSPTETVNGVELPIYRGDMVNKNNPTLEDRDPNPNNLLEGYYRSASTLNLLRAFTKGGFASLSHIHDWNLAFLKNSAEGQKYESLAAQIDDALTFMKTVGIDEKITKQLNEVNFFTSHEALLLDYEETMVRRDSLSGKLYCCSAHFLWIGDRTRQPDNAHVEFFRTLENPIGIKVGPSYDIEDLKRILDKINPDNEKGKIVLITRFGAEKICEYLPELARKVKALGHNVLWSCDPMHGNTFSTGIHKTRNFDAIFSEITNFFSIAKSEGFIPGGIHAELTGLDVTECIGGAQKIDEKSLSNKYATTCDPRLNASQSIELAFKLGEMLRK